MRLYNIYYICCVCKDEIDENLDLVSNKNEKGQIVSYRIKGWGKCRKALEQLRNISCLKEYSENVYGTIGVIERDQENPVVSPDVKNRFEKSLNELKIAIESIKRLYRSLDIGESSAGIDIKIPKCETLKEYVDYLKEIDFIFSQCPYLLSSEEEVKFNNVDVGSQWITFSVITAGTFCILNNLAKLIDKAIFIKSHIISLKQQEEILETMRLKNEATNETIDVFKKMKRMVMDGYVNDLESEIGELSNGEERGKVEKSLEKLSLLIDKGVEIYSSIDTPNEVKVLFPTNEDNLILPDNIIKLLEKKDDKE